MTTFDDILRDQAVSGILALIERVAHLESLAKVGGDSPLFGTGFAPNIKTVTTTYIPLKSDFLILGDTTAGTFAINLPTAASVPKWIFCFKKIDANANNLTPTGNGGELIDGSGTYALAAQYDSVMMQSDGVSAWHIIAVSP